MAASCMPKSVRSTPAAAHSAVSAAVSCLRRYGATFLPSCSAIGTFSPQSIIELIINNINYPIISFLSGFGPEQNASTFPATRHNQQNSSTDVVPACTVNEAISSPAAPTRTGNTWLMTSSCGDVTTHDVTESCDYCAGGHPFSISRLMDKVQPSR